MLLIKLYIIVTVFGRMCLAKYMIDINKPNGLAAIEDAAIRILTTCYTEQDKTIVLLGNHSRRFIQKLTSYRNFALVLSDPIKRAENNVKESSELDRMKRHKVHIVAMMASDFLQFPKLFSSYRLTRYDDSMASVFILGASPNWNYAPCADETQIAGVLEKVNFNNMPNANLFCRDTAKIIRIYTLNYFVNQAPSPWQFVQSVNDYRRWDVHLFERKYEDQDGVCRNLDFDRTHNLGGSEIQTIVPVWEEPTAVKKTSNPAASRFRRIRVYSQSHLSFIDSFIAYINASRKYVWHRTVPGKLNVYDERSMVMMPVFFRDDEFATGISFYTYPLEKDCITFVTQFRGYKSQLQKILSVIDTFSWGGMYIVYLITLVFLKYFLRLPVPQGFLNLCRLSCNCGLVMPSSVNVGSQIYIGCLLFFVVTMQGIFQGNLASLLTHDFPERHANSINDLLEFGYTIYTEKVQSTLFNDPAFKGRVHITSHYWSCITDVVRNASVACVVWDPYSIEFAIKQHLHISSNCIAQEYWVTKIPKHWLLEETINDFLKNAVATVTMMPLSIRIEMERLHESESQEVVLEPEVMTLEDLGFAFVILLIGLAFASITFISELMVYRYQHRIRTTRVIILS